MMNIGDWLVFKFTHYPPANEAVFFLYHLQFKKASAQFYIFHISIYQEPDHSLIARYEKSIAKNEKNLPAVLLARHTTEFDLFKSVYLNQAEDSAKKPLTIGRKKFSCQASHRKESRGKELVYLTHPDIPFDFPARIFSRPGHGPEIEYLRVTALGNKKISGADFPDKSKAHFFSPAAEKKIFQEDEFANYLTSLRSLTPGQDGTKKWRILHAQTKKLTTFHEMMMDCTQANVVFAGEVHDSAPCHKIQLNIIKALLKKGKKFSIGMEMFYRSEDIQKGLDDFIDGKISENEFRKKIYNPCWSPDWYRLYRDIFIFARKNKIPLVGLNCPKNLMADFKRDPDTLTPLMRSWFAQKVDYHDRQHREITMWNFRAMADMGMMVDALYPGQCVWDDTMAETIFFWLLKKPKQTMVVLIGELHITYHVTVPGRLAKRFQEKGLALKYRTIIPHNAKAFTAEYFDKFTRHTIADYAHLMSDESPPQTESAKDEESSIDDSWVEAYYMLNKGKVREAEEALANDKSEIGKKVRQRIQILKKAEKLARGKKFTEASNLIHELDEVYKGIKKIYLKKLSQCQKTGSWPEELKLE
jgi:uncharacterized iron-regulated protein